MSNKIGFYNDDKNINEITCAIIANNRINSTLFMF